VPPISRFQSLEEEIRYQIDILSKEREYERSEKSKSQKEKFKLRQCIWEDERFVQGETWRVSFSHPTVQNKTFPSWLAPGSPILIESENFSCFGNIHSIQNNHLVVQIRGDMDWEKERYDITEWFSETTYEQYQEICEQLLKNPDPSAYKKLSWSLGYSLSTKPTPPNKISNEKSSTKEERFFNIPDYGFIFGPPGTGKTTFLLHLASLLKTNKKTVLVLCPTNFACDHIIELSIKKGFQPIRLGNSTKIRDEILEFHIENLIQKHRDQKQISQWRNDLKNIKKKIQSWKRNFGREERAEREEQKKEAKFLLSTIRTAESNLRNQLLESCDLVVSTFSGFYNEFKRGRRFDFVFVDESTQCLDPACYMAFLSGERTFFFGDPKQLPPSYLHPDFQNQISYLERAIGIDSGERVIFLNEQFRMEPEILKFPNERFYEGKIQTHKDRKNEFKESYLGRNSKLVWIDTAGSDTEEQLGLEGTSLFNQTEIDLIQQLSKGEWGDSRITVISPYREQVERLKSLNLPILDIQTIDSFQGREADVIVISLVRSNSSGEIGFLLSPKRLNVALTRARSQLILIGDSSTVCQSKDFQSLFENFERFGEIRSIYEFLDFT